MVGTIQEVIEMRKGQRRLEEMSEFDRQLCEADKAKHLIIPRSDVYNLRRIAGILHGLAADFDQLSRRSDVKARSIIFEMAALVDDANKRMREMTGKGKRKKPWEQDSERE